MFLKCFQLPLSVKTKPLQTTCTKLKQNIVAKKVMRTALNTDSLMDK